MTPDAGVDLGNPVPNDYFKSKGPFVPTDVEQLDGKLYITTGYSKLDYVLTARILKTSRWNWPGTICHLAARVRSLVNSTRATGLRCRRK